MKRKCLECGRKRERCRPVVLTADGFVLFCCPECWKELDYIDFFFKVPPAEP